MRLVEDGCSYGINEGRAKARGHVWLPSRRCWTETGHQPTRDQLLQVEYPRAEQSKLVGSISGSTPRTRILCAGVAAGSSGGQPVVVGKRQRQGREEEEEEDGTMTSPIFARRLMQSIPLALPYQPLHCMAQPPRPRLLVCLFVGCPLAVLQCNAVLHTGKALNPSRLLIAEGRLLQDSTVQ